MSLEISGLAIPASLTVPAFNFLEEQGRIGEFHVYLISTNHFVSFKRDEFKTFYEEWEGAFSEGEPVLSPVEKYRYFESLINFSTHERFINEASLTRAVDNFLTYLTDLLSLVFETVPESLSSEEKISVEFVLSFPDRESLITGLTERRVLNLSYLGLEQLRTDMKKRMKFDLFLDSELFQDVNRIVEYRNLLAHNSGVINAVFQKRVPEHPGNVGERIHISYGDMHQFRRTLSQATLNIDVRAVEKWGLPTDPTESMEISREI